jgi:hypothetical protein
MNRIRLIIAAAILAGCSLAWGCGASQVVPLQAQVGGGMTSPQLQSQFGPNNVVDSSTALTVQVTNFCNAQAQVDYGWLVQLCGGAITLPSLPVSISTNIGTQLAQQGQKAWCQANMWTGPSGQLSVPIDPASKNPIIPALGNCPSGAAPAPVPAPSGAPAAKS